MVYRKNSVSRIKSKRSWTNSKRSRTNSRRRVKRTRMKGKFKKRIFLKGGSGKSQEITLTRTDNETPWGFTMSKGRNLIMGVVDGSPAAAATDIIPGRTITYINGRNINNINIQNEISGLKIKLTIIIPDYTNMATSSPILDSIISNIYIDIDIDISTILVFIDTICNRNDSDSNLMYLCKMDPHSEWENRGIPAYIEIIEKIKYLILTETHAPMPRNVGSPPKNVQTDIVTYTYNESKIIEEFKIYEPGMSNIRNNYKQWWLGQDTVVDWVFIEKILKLELFVFLIKTPEFVHMELINHRVLTTTTLGEIIIFCDKNNFKFNTIFDINLRQRTTLTISEYLNSCKSYEINKELKSNKAELNTYYLPICEGLKIGVV
jgi:hypothetical protein